MTNDSTEAKPEPERNALPVRLMQLMHDKAEQIKADNKRLKNQRNARRWKAERDPAEYERQKAAQREAYRHRISSEEDREIRAYQPVDGKTRQEREANARQRDAERKKAERAGFSQDEKDREADRKWARRQVNAGKTAEEIETGLAKRVTDRKNRPVPYGGNPNFGRF